MKVVEHSSAEAFLTATEAYRAADPVQTNLLGSIAEGVRSGRRYDSEQWLSVTARRGVVGAALRTAPYSLVVGPMDDLAARALGDQLRLLRRPIPGITGPAGVVDRVAERLGHPVRIRIREVLRVLDGLVEPPPPDGSARRAKPSDVPLVRRWQEAYLVEVGMPVRLADDATVALMLERMWLWEAAGEPVAMAGHAPVVPGPGGAVGRVGPVYTEPGARGRGFGSALTAEVARALLAADARVMLLADAANATSNRVYERLGFRAVGEHIEADLL